MFLVEPSIGPAPTLSFFVESYGYTAFGVPTIYDENGAKIGKSNVGNTIMFHGKPFDLETGLYYSGSGVYYSPDVAVDVNTPAVYYLPEDYGESGERNEIQGVVTYEDFLRFIKKQKIERSDSGQPFVSEKIADNWEDLPYSVRGSGYVGLYREIVNSVGDYRNKLRMIEGYHIVEYNNRKGIYVHYDVYNPLNLDELLGHICEWYKLHKGENRVIFQNLNPDFNSVQSNGK